MMLLFWGLELSPCMEDWFSRTLPACVLTEYVAFTEAVSAGPTGASPTLIR